MWIIARSGQTVRELSDFERALVVGHSMGSLRGPDQERASRILRDTRRKSHWLGCDCARPMPVMNVTLKDSGTLVVKNNPTGGAHAPNCPLLKQESGSDSEAPRRSNSVDRVTPEAHLSLHREFSGVTPGNSDQISRTGASSNGQSKKRQLSFLLSVAEAAGLHEYDNSAEKSIADQFQRIREAVWRYQLVPGVPAQTYTDTRIDKRRIAGLAAKLRDAKSFGIKRRYGLMLDVVGGIKGRHLELLPEGSLDFFGHVERWSPAGGPNLVLATLATQAGKSNFFELGHVAIIPVLSSRTFLPVASDAERENLAQLIGIIEWMNKQHKARVILRRQLFSDLNLIELQGKGKLLTVDLSPSALVGGTPSPTVFSLAECGGDISVLKKRVARYFLGDK